MTSRVGSACGALVRTASLFLLFAFSCALAGAQTPMPQMNMDHRGTLQGRVRNASDAPVPDATVTAVNAENGAQFTSRTNAQGEYTFTGALPPGKYEVSILSGGVTAFRRAGVEIVADKPTT